VGCARPTIGQKIIGLKFSLHRLKIGSPDMPISPEFTTHAWRVERLPMALTDERQGGDGAFCAQKGLEPFTEYLAFNLGQRNDYRIRNSKVIRASGDPGNDLLRSVYNAKADRIHFALM